MAEGDAFERLVRAFDTLDGAEAFVHPDAMAEVAGQIGIHDLRQRAIRHLKRTATRLGFTLLPQSVAA